MRRIESKYMDLESRNKIEIEDENGFIKEYEIIALIRTKDGNYLVYTDGKILKNGGIALYVNSIIKKDDSILLEFVTDAEMSFILEKLKERIDND